MTQRESHTAVDELLSLGDLGLELGYWGDAARYYDRVLEEAPGHPLALLGRARSRRDPHEALRDAQDCLARWPSNRAARELVSRLEAQIEECERQGCDADGCCEGGGPVTRLRRRGAPSSRADLGGSGLVRALVSRVARIPQGGMARQAVLGVYLCVSAVAILVIVLIASQGVWASSAQPGSAGGPLAQAQAATVFLMIPDRLTGLLGRGSGSIITADGLVLTNYHVLTRQTGALANEQGLAFVGLTTDARQPPTQWYIGTLVAADPIEDLALLRLAHTAEGRAVDDRRFATMPLGEPDSLDLGHPLVGLGYPALGGNTLTLTSGSVAGFSRAPGRGLLIKTDSELLPGSSGGAVLNGESRLVGVITSADAEARTQGRLSYFVPLGEAEALLAQAQYAPVAADVDWMAMLFSEAVSSAR